jgi:dTDP-4-dehydrorhamnose 3,5-epimerase
VVCDQVGRPTFTAELVRAVEHLLGAGAAWGTYNVSNGGPAVSWAGFTREIFAQAGLPNAVTDISSAAYAAGAPGTAPRPADSRFDLGKLAATGFASRDWRLDLADYLAREAAREPAR